MKTSFFVHIRHISESRRTVAVAEAIEAVVADEALCIEAAVVAAMAAVAVSSKNT